MTRILIVDDEKSIRKTLKAFLSLEGYEVEVAEEVETALELLKESTFDIVISDIVMPRTTGVTLLKNIRDMSPDVKVIMMTGEPTLETAVEAVRAGASDYLTKPVGKIAILHAVANVIMVKELEDEKQRLTAENIQYQEKLEQLVDDRTTELRSTLNELKQAQEQLIQQERMSALGQMASGIAHDFNNALMPIVGFSEMLLDDPSALDDREDALHMLGMIKSSGEDARNIVHRLRDVYKKNNDADYELLKLSEVLDVVANITMPKWKEEMSARGINIELTTEVADVPQIRGNLTELREALTNLIFNSVDAMSYDGKITLRLDMPNNENVRLQVIDTGVGMNEDAYRHCMEPFFTSKGELGTGLGLPMVYGIVQRHGGRCEIDSTLGIGTRVIMHFPVPTDMVSSDVVPAKEFESLPPMRLLVIDDEASARDILRRMLTMEGHSVDTAVDGVQGIEKMHNAEYDMVLTDRAMPMLSGDEVAAEIARLNPEVPVIMVTGFGDIMREKGEHPAGVTFVMSKPVTRIELRRVMAQVMQSR